MTTFYVSNQGNDAGNDGLSQERSLKTIQMAISRTKPGDVVMLKGGDVFRETVRPNSGTPGSSILFTSYGYGKATISGCDIASGNWQSAGKNILKLGIPASMNLGTGRNQVFLIDASGKLIHLTEARWPKVPRAKTLADLEIFEDYAISDAGGYDPSSGNAQGEYKGTYSDSALDFPPNFWVGGTITFLPGRAWGGQSTTIIASAPGKVDFLIKLRSSSASVSNAYYPSASNPYFLSGKLEALTQEEEFFIDSGNFLYLYPPGGSLNGCSVEVKVRNIGFDLKDRSYIDIDNINLVACQIIDSTASVDIKLTKVSIQYGYHSIWDVGSSVKLRGKNCKVLWSDISNSSGEGLTLEGSNSEVRHTVICGCDYFGLGASGLRVQASASKSTIANNSIFNTGYHGLLAYAWESLFANNRVWNFGKKTTDISGINVYASGDGKGTEICYNMVHDARAHYDPALDFNGGMLFRFDSGNEVEGVSNYKFHHNVGWKATNNALACWPLKTNHTNYGNAKNSFVNNTFFGTVFFVTKDGYSIAGTEFCNNIATSYSYGGNSSTIPDGFTVNQNLFVENSLTNNLNGEPGFVSSENYNFLLQANSQSANAGLEIAPYTSKTSHGKPHLGAIAPGDKPFVAGAWIRPEDVAGLRFEQDAIDPYKIIISGFPAGRNLPQTFKISVEGGTPSDNFYNVVNSSTNQISAVAYIDSSNKGMKNLQVSLDGISFAGVNKTVDLGGLEIYTATYLPEKDIYRIKLKGRKFYTQNCHAIPIRVSKSLSDPFLVRIDTQSLIAKGLMRADGSDLRIVNFDFSKELDYWIESGINTRSTLVWIKLPTNSGELIQNFEDRSSIYVVFGNPAWTSTTGKVGRVFPALNRSVAFWLKGHECQGADNAEIGSWQGQQITAIQSDATKRPKLRYNQLNGLAGLEFDGINDFLLLGGNFGASASATFFVVYLNPSPGNTKSQRLLSASASGTVDYTVGMGLNVRNDVSGVTLPNASGAVAIASIGNPPKDLTNIHLGIKHTTLSNSYKGVILEVFAVPALTTAQEQKDIRQFLELKYALLRPDPTAILEYNLMTSPIKVDMDGLPCTVASIPDSSQLECLTTVSPRPGKVVKVTNPDGEFALLTL